YGASGVPRATAGARVMADGAYWGTDLLYVYGLRSTKCVSCLSYQTIPSDWTLFCPPIVRFCR
ncbi:MAG: hypothetical protein QOC80_1521, partial [Frankiaceae bacterium]|nr:hypothetical protein [Frankiaceae bacterium]